jgi:hypothetical protein
MSITVVIPAYNASRFIAATLERRCMPNDLSVRLQEVRA